MKTWKRALALVLALVMALSLVALPSFAEGETGTAAKYNVIIRYVFENGNSAASDWTATIDRGTDLERTIKSPDVTGYTPDPSEVKVSVQNIQKDVLYTVTYKPAQVNFTVEHYQQNLNDDKYTKCDTVTKTGFTESRSAKTWPRLTRASPSSPTTPPPGLPPTAAPWCRFTTIATTIC